MKISTDHKSNNYCPQTLFVYGTYKEDGTPNFGLFCWFSYYWDEELGVMACIGGEKLTKDRIQATGVFSANLVTEEILPLADYFGNVEGYKANKMDLAIEAAQGKVLPVPVLLRSPWSYELEVDKTLQMDDGVVYLCKIRNIQAEEELLDKNADVAVQLQRVKPVRTTNGTYFGLNGECLGKWGEPMKAMKR